MFVTPTPEEPMSVLIAVIGMAICIACMTMMGGMALKGIAQLLRRADR
jgi:hypothetical protein